MNSSGSDTRRNVGVLAACQAMLFTNNSTLIAINGLAGLALAPYIGLATLPVTCWILGGGLVGGILGPTLSRYTVELSGPKFMGAYLALIVFALVTVVLLRFIRIPDPTAAEQAATGRPLAQIAAQPKFIVAVLAGAL